MLDAAAPLTKSLDELERISAGMPVYAIPEFEDPLLRNELITHNYWRIASRCYAVMPGDDLVWPTFGSWASAQAGVYMRVGRSQLGRFAMLGGATKVTELLGRGNQLIFRDIGLPFTRFLDLIEETPAAELRSLIEGADVRDRLAGELGLNPRSVFEDPNGERLMVLAFEQYLRAHFETDREARSERIFVANGCVGLQEQTRVNCMIAALLDSVRINGSAKRMGGVLNGVRHLARIGSRAAWPMLKPAMGIQAASIERQVSNLDGLFDAIIVEERASQVLGTTLFMELELGNDRFDLSDDITGHRFAKGLERIDLDAPDFRETLELVMAWDKTPDSTTGTAVSDWSALDERMHFIIDLFRVHQDDLRLRRHPLVDA